MTASPDAAEATISVPRVYQDYLVAGRDRFLAVVLTAFVSVEFIFGILLKNGSVIHSADFVIPAFAVAAWLFERKRQWRYTVNPKMITTIWAEANGWVWEWRTIFWTRTPITSVEETEWRGLPAIRLLGGKRKRKRPPAWLIVYNLEDAERVKTEILPMIEAYRRQYRQDSLAERLRS